jgi:hypothetical protein
VIQQEAIKLTQRPPEKQKFNRYLPVLFFVVSAISTFLDDGRPVKVLAGVLWLHMGT